MVGAIECKCGELVVIDAGQVYLDYKHENKKISEEAAIHMSKYRANCPKCKVNFCGNC